MSTSSAGGIALVAIFLNWRGAGPRLMTTFSVLLGLTFLVGTFLGGWHALFEWDLAPGPDTCAAVGVSEITGNLSDLLGKPLAIPSCKDAMWRLPDASWGLSMAGWNSIVSTDPDRAELLFRLAAANARHGERTGAAMTLSSNRRQEMLRVDHAGEYGAVAIYRGQLAVFERQQGRERITGQLKEMAAQEQEHLDAFDKLLNAGSVRPTALSPVWNAAGFALGAATALLGEKAAHACTEAVETVIEEHYGDQITELEAVGRNRAGGDDDEIPQRGSGAQGTRDKRGRG